MTVTNVELVAEQGALTSGSFADFLSGNGPIEITYSNAVGGFGIKETGTKIISHVELYSSQTGDRVLFYQPTSSTWGSTLIQKTNNYYDMTLTSRYASGTWAVLRPATSQLTETISRMTVYYTDGTVEDTDTQNAPIKRYSLFGTSILDNNGIITNTDATNYAITKDSISGNFDIIIKIKFATTSTNLSLLALSTASSNVCVYSNNTNKISWWNGYTSASASTANTYQNINSWVFIRLRYDGSKLYLGVKNSTQSETLDEALIGNWETIEAQSGNPANGDKWNIGYTPFNAWNLQGATIDFTNSSINGDLFYEELLPPSSSNIKLGLLDLVKCYVGNTEVSKIYLGTTVLYG